MFIDLHSWHAGADRAEGAAIFSRRLRFEVKEVYMAGSAIGPEQDDREVVVALLGLIRRICLRRQQARQTRQAAAGQRPQTNAANGQPSPATNGTAAVDGF